MDDLLLHPKTKKQVKSLLGKPPHALLIYGPLGSGKLRLALNISAGMLNTVPDKLHNHPYFTLIARPEGKQDIPIEAIRGVIKQLNLKAASAEQRIVNRVIVIDQADRMSAEAQNALLKVIEEPPAKTVFILTSPSDHAVLPTIASRTERLPVSPVSLEDAVKFFSADYSETQTESAWRLSGGAAALMEAILKDDSAHPLKAAVEQAKQLLAADKYNRLLMLDSLSEDKARFGEVLDALSRTLAALHHSAIKTGNARQAGRLLNARKLVDSAQASLKNNTSGRLLALNLAAQLPL
jgi:DNA polymerase-3 subunit delta'